MDYSFVVSPAKQGFRGCKPMKRKYSSKESALVSNLWFLLVVVFFFVSFGLDWFGYGPMQNRIHRAFSVWGLPPPGLVGLYPTGNSVNTELNAVNSVNVVMACGKQCKHRYDLW